MIKTNFLLKELSKYGYNFFTGVPCSHLTSVINGVINSKKIKYVGATSEGESVGIASGAWLAGKKSVVMIQNSGLGNTINPLTSLNYPFRIPILLISTWRGDPKTNDEPQHKLIGEKTRKILELIKVKNDIFPTNKSGLQKILAKINKSINKFSLPYCLIMRKNSIEKENLKQKRILLKKKGKKIIFKNRNSIPSRYEVLKLIVKNIKRDIGIVTTTGKTGRELFTINDSKQFFYQVGSMGCASAIGLGIALNNKKKIIVIDGDGAALMKMGNFTTIGANQPLNLIHILLDNNVHDSTGQQLTNASTVDFTSVAISCGYKISYLVNNLNGFERSLKESLKKKGPIFINVKIKPGSINNLGRPTVSPNKVARRFQNFLKD
ncbi:MAG: hypothetical protein CFH23_00513 [Alphaproteobacteria bacterium MarineAlpha6_Bin1]|nr:MAG: hypothetical protein CFH23_00513 [Alphaproteobacteria bacterium MarineAlpha6_Bin1]